MTVVQFFMIWYHLIFSDNRKALGYAWNLLGFVAKLVQGVRLPLFSYSAPRLTAPIRSFEFSDLPNSSASVSPRYSFPGASSC